MKHETNQRFNRRSFLGKASRFAVAVPVLGLGAVLSCNNARSSSRSASVEPNSTPWKTTIVAEGEPGEPLTISGTIYAPDGRTPLEGISLFVYQTDKGGLYSTTGGDNRSTKIHGACEQTRRGVMSFAPSDQGLIRAAATLNTSMLMFRVPAIPSIGSTSITSVTIFH